MTNPLYRRATLDSEPPVCTSHTPPLIPDGTELTLVITAITTQMLPIGELNIEATLALNDPATPAFTAYTLNAFYCTGLNPTGIGNQTSQAVTFQTMDLDQPVRIDATPFGLATKTFFFDLRKAAKAGGAI